MIAPAEAPQYHTLHLVRIDDHVQGITMTREHAEELIRRFLAMCWPSVDQSVHEDYEEGTSYVHRYYKSPMATDGYVRVRIDIQAPWTPDAKWPVAKEDL